MDQRDYVIPAQPGFFVLSWMEDGEGELFTETPVIAWRVFTEGSSTFVLPITLDPEVNGYVDSPYEDWAILDPQKRLWVDGIEYENYPQLTELFRNRKVAREKRREKK